MKSIEIVSNVTSVMSNLLVKQGRNKELHIHQAGTTYGSSSLRKHLQKFRHFIICALRMKFLYYVVNFATKVVFDGPPKFCSRPS